MPRGNRMFLIEAKQWRSAASCQTSPAKRMGFNVQFFKVANANTHENDRIIKREKKKQFSASSQPQNAVRHTSRATAQQLVRFFSKPDEL